MIQNFFANISLDDIYFGNRIFDYAIMLIILLVSITLLVIVQKILTRKFRHIARKKNSKTYESLEDITRNMNAPFISFLAIYIASQYLTIRGNIADALSAILALWVTWKVMDAIKIIIDRHFTEDDSEDRSAKRIVHFVINALLGISGFLWALSSFGINITSLLAGVGISGVLIAFAAQNILSDLFSSFSIFLDKPFVIGDSITVGANSGTVEKIGMKTTRLRSTQGEELVISNKELAAARIQNFKSMTERKVTFSIKLDISTPTKKLREVPAWIKEAVEGEPRTRFDRAHFKTIGDNSFEFEIAYYAVPPGYSDFLDAQQHINLAILEKLEKEKVKLLGAPKA